MIGSIPLINNGYFGKVILADLASGDIKEKIIPDEIYENFLGGYGLGVKLIYDWTRKGYDPLSSEAILGFLPGLLTGTNAPFSGRYMVCGKSPLTGGWGDANSGGFFGPAIKKAGYDGIFISGIADTPSYLLISEEGLSMNNATDLWGLDAIETDLKLQEIHGHETRVCSIGKAGEKVSLISGVVNDKGRIAARSGLGAVMGIKKLKAIAIKKKGVVPVKYKKFLLSLTRHYNNHLIKQPGRLIKALVSMMPKLPKILRWTKSGLTGTPDLMFEVYHQFGTTALNAIAPEIGDAPVKNWGGIGYLDFPLSTARNITGHNFIKYKLRSYGCSACPVQCGAILSAPEINPNLRETHRPEYETCTMFGTLSLNNNIESILAINDMCNRAGIDSISAGASISFAIECFEKGILSAKDTGGLELHWGDSNAIIRLVDMIINRDGFGDVLADGTKRAVERIGKGCEAFAINAGGQELPGHDPRHFPSLGLSYSSDPTPGRHTTASINFAEMGPIRDYLPGINITKSVKHNPKKLAENQRIVTGVHQVISALGLCTFSTLYGTFPLLQFLDAATGWKLSAHDVLKIGWRIQTMRLAFSLREGVNPYKVSLPGRAWGEKPAEKGPHAGETVDYKEMNRFYYEEMGWDATTGIPTLETLKGLGLESLYEDIS